jgi:hypothetical protein
MFLQSEGTWKKNQQVHKHEAADVLAYGTASGTGMVGTLDHVAALLERLVVTAPSSCFPKPSSSA